MIRLTGAELRRLVQPRSNRIVLVACATLVATVLVLQASRGQQLSLVHDLSGGLTGVGTALAFVTVAAGSSTVSKEFGSGSLVMLLTWEPRRGRVVVGKSLALAIAAAIAAACVACILTLGLGVAAAFGSGKQSIDATWIADRASQFGYLLLGIATAGFISATLTFITRSTALTVSLFFLLYLLGERALDELVPGAAEWAPAGLVVQLASGGAGLFQLDVASSTAAWRALLWLGAFALLAGVNFRMREVR